MSSTGDLPTFSYEFLSTVKRGGSSETYRSRLAAIDESALTELNEDEDTAKAFWINLYNAFVQLHLEQDPSLYESNRGRLGESPTVLPA